MSIQQQQSLEEEMQYSDEYARWLMANEIVWDERLVDLMEDAHRFDEFMATLPEK